MGNCVSAQDREALQRSQEIDKQIEEDSRKFKKECKILLLGASSSPRSPRADAGSDAHTVAHAHVSARAVSSDESPC